MPLTDTDFALLQKTQSLCSELEFDLKKLIAFKKYLNDVNKRYKGLSDLYHTHWQRLTESELLDSEQRMQIEAMVTEGEYSIFGQDTIWNVLSDIHIEYTQLLKSLAKKI